FSILIEYRSGKREHTGSIIPADCAASARLIARERGLGGYRLRLLAVPASGYDDSGKEGSSHGAAGPVRSAAPHAGVRQPPAGGTGAGVPQPPVGGVS